MNRRVIGFALVPIGILLIILGAIFLPISVNDYQHGVSSSTCATAGYVMTCTVTYAQATIMIFESALGLAFGISAFVGAFLLLRGKTSQL